jgi:hypothetical protein
MPAPQLTAIELRSHLSALHIPLDRSTRVALRAHVARYVDEGKELGWTPQHVIVAVKRIAHDAGLRPSENIVESPTRLAMTATDRLLVDLVGWCIDRYYDDE